MAKLVSAVLSGLSIGDVEDGGDVIVVRASTRDGEVACLLVVTRPDGFTPSITKLLKRQMYGRAGLALLRHRILLG